jgi:hypothetical protein
VSAIRVDVTLPVLRIGMGPYTFDPLERLLGAPVEDLLGSLMAGPVVQRRTESGLTLDVYPLALPDGEGATLPLGGLGELGFFNLCRAKHKFAYAEPAPMRSARTVPSACSRAMVAGAPHNHGRDRAHRPRSSSSSLSGTVNLPGRRRGGTTASSVSSRSAGSCVR